MPKGRLSLVAINVLIFVVLAEIAAVGFYYVQHGAFFYTAARESPPALPETRRGELSADVLHPYFGPIHRPGVRPQTNNVGFGSTRAFPYTRANDRQYLVGIFGGSVAQAFCDRGTARLIAALQRDADFATREIVPLCFSHEGYKQPQQLIVLAYFLSLGQQYDLVINIDGFNEVALGSRSHERGRDISMPSPIHVDPLLNLIDQATLTPARVQALARISAYKERLNRLGERLRRSPVATVHFALDRYYVFTMKRYQAEVAAYDALPSNPPASSVLVLTPPMKTRDTETVVYEDIAAGWASASLLMRDMLASRGVRYLHVLQPNQYFTRRVFGEEEARIALNDEQPFKQPAAQGYPVLARAAAAFAGKEEFVDGTTAFDSETAAVYEDDCCHYTDRGYEILAELIASKVRHP
ncbi:MAG: hypothetical protein ACRD3G_13015 [Vicinamibacterales bacterium]